MDKEKLKNMSKELREHHEQQAASGTFTEEKQYFENIKKIYAKAGFIHIEVYDKAKIKPDVGNPLRDTILSVYEACERAAALNLMAHKLPPHTRDTIMDIVDNVIASAREAQRQRDNGEDLLIKEKDSDLKNTSLEWVDDKKERIKDPK